MEDRKITWEEINLFKSDEAENEIDDEEESDDYIEQEKKEMSPKFIINGQKFNKLVQTPIGPFILSDAFHPLRGLDILLAHVNFPITKGLVKKLDEVAGLEAFKIVGRYRLLFVFGKIFDTDDVIKEIEKVMGISNQLEKISLEELNEETQSIFYELDKKITSDFWVAYIFPNGNYLYENLENDEQVIEKYEDYKKLYELSHGILLSSIEPK